MRISKKELEKMLLSAATAAEWSAVHFAIGNGLDTALAVPGLGREIQNVRDRMSHKPAQELLEHIRAATAEYKGSAPAVAMPKHIDTDRVSVYAIGDPHIGMLSWRNETGANSDTDIGCENLRTGFATLVDRTPESHVGIIAQLGDFFHAQDDKQVTPTSQHKLDVDSRWPKIMRAGLRLMRELVDQALSHHKLVVVANLRGNHDPTAAVALNEWLSAVYENEKRVLILDNAAPHLYWREGNVLIGMHHGDGTPKKELPGVMATDRRQDWGSTEHHYWFTGHIHQDSRTEFSGCVVQSFRTMATRDQWSTWKGYRSGQSVQSVTFHREHGESETSRVNLSEVRSILGQE